MSKTFYKLTDSDRYTSFLCVGETYYGPKYPHRYAVGTTIAASTAKGIRVSSSIDKAFYLRGDKSVLNIKIWEISVEDEDVVYIPNVLGEAEAMFGAKKLTVVREVPNEEIYGEHHKKAFDFIKKTKNIDWFRPKKDLDLNVIEALVKKHLNALGGYGSERFSDVKVQFAKEWTEYTGTGDLAHSYSVATEAARVLPKPIPHRIAASWSGMNGNYDAAEKAASAAVGSLCEDWDFDVTGCWGMEASSITRNIIGNILAGTKDEVWTPLWEIYRMGCVPVTNIVDGEFIVWIPQYPVNPIDTNQDIG